MLCSSRKLIFNHAKDGKIKEVLKYLQAGGSPYAIEDKTDYTIAMYAAKSGHLEVLRLLRKYGVCFTSKSLLIAAAQGHLDIFKWLLKQQPNPIVYSFFKLLGNDVSININYQDNRLRNSLFQAIHGRHLNIVEYIFANKAALRLNASAVNFRGYTYLMEAVNNRDYEMVAFLLNQPEILTNLDTVNIDGHTVLSLSLFIRNYNITKLLINKCGVIDSDECRFFTPNLASKRGSLELLQLLYRKKPDLQNYKSTDPNTPLLLAASNGYFDIVKWLVTTRRADLYDTSASGFNCIEEASRSAHLDIVLWLLNSQYTKETMVNFPKYADVILRAAVSKHDFNGNALLWLLEHDYISIKTIAKREIIPRAIHQKCYKLVKILLENSEIDNVIACEHKFLKQAIEDYSYDVARLLLEYYLINDINVPEWTLCYLNIHLIVLDMQQQIINLELTSEEFDPDKVYHTYNLKFQAISTAIKPQLPHAVCQTILQFTSPDARIKQYSKYLESKFVAKRNTFKFVKH